MDYEHLIAQHEAANTNACRECAVKNGHTIDEADNCDDGNVGCPDCPWGAIQVHNAKVEADSRGFMREVAPRTEG